jgi:lysosomal alpha-glucosidase
MDAFHFQFILIDCVWYFFFILPPPPPPTHPPPSSTSHLPRQRYTLLPHLYTLFAIASLRGETVARPLFFEFPGDVNTLEADARWGSYLLGASLLVTPVLAPGKTTVESYLPNADWYFWKTGRVLHRHNHRAKAGRVVTMAAPLGEALPVLLRGGAVVATSSNDAVRFAACVDNFLFLYVLFV